MVFLRFSQGYNSSNGFLDQTWRVYKSKTLTCILYTWYNFFQIFFYNLWISLNFFFFFLCQNFSEFSGFQTLLFYRKQKCAISFYSLLPLPKRIRQGLIAWILFLSLFSLWQKNEGLTVWILLCLSSHFAKKNSTRTNRLNSFCVSLLPFPKEQRTNRLNYFVSPFSLVKEFKMTQSENSFDSSLSLIQKISKD